MTVALLAATVAFAVAVAGLAVAVWRAVPRETAASWGERGVELGMSEAQVERSFLDAASGSWTRGTSCGGVALEWRRRAPNVPTRWARFELHDGWLVAIRIHTDSPSRAAQAAQSWSAVRQTRPYGGGTATTVIARGCATHAAEAEQIARAAVASGP